MRYSRHSRHIRRRPSRAELRAQNMKRRVSPPADAAPKPNSDRLPDTLPTPQTDQFVGYHIAERKGGWYALIGPDGEQVGKSSRDVGELRALIPGAD